MELPENGTFWQYAGPMLLIALYIVIDKIVIPLVGKTKSKAIATGNGNGRRKHDAIIEKLTTEIRELSNALTAHTAEAGVHRATIIASCKRFERDVRDLHGRVTSTKKECMEHTNDVRLELSGRIETIARG